MNTEVPACQRMGGFIKDMDRAFDRYDPLDGSGDREALKEELLTLIKDRCKAQWQHGFNCGDTWRCNAVAGPAAEHDPMPSYEEAEDQCRRRDAYEAAYDLETRKNIDEFVAGWNATAGEPRCQVFESAAAYEAAQSL